jgi:putative ABC transport system permease protein
MWAHYLKSTVRNLQKHKVHSCINIGGMAMGITCAVVAILYAEYELSYDTWIKEHEHTYRLESYYHFPGAQASSVNAVGGPTGEALARWTPEIVAFTRMSSFTNAALTTGDRAFNETVTFVDGNFMAFMGLSMAAGTASSIGGDLNALLISEETALKYFGNTDPIGQIITLNGIKDYQVSGVFTNITNQSHLNMDFLALFDEKFLIDEFSNENVMSMWNLPFFSTYVRFHENADVREIENRLIDFVNAKYVHPNPARANMTPTDYVHFGLRPIQDIHLRSPHLNENKPSGSYGAVIGGLVIAFMIVGIAVFNYVSLVTATASLRAREICLRKIMGATEGDIRIQFLSESIALCVLATVLALAAVDILLPAITNLLNLQDGDLSYTDSRMSLVLVTLIGPVVGLIAGSYPAFHLAHIRPSRVLGTSRSEGVVNSTIRSFLVTLQFAVSIGLIISVITVARQTNYLSTMDIGVLQDNISIVRHDSAASQQALPTLLEEIRGIPGVVQASATSTVATDGLAISTAVLLPGRIDDDALSIWFAATDPDYFETFGIRLLSGRHLSEVFANDLMGPLNEAQQDGVVNIVINESAVSYLGHQNMDDALGAHFQIGGSNLNNEFTNVTIVGVVNDFQIGSAYEIIRPMLFINRPESFNKISVRSKPESYNDVQLEITRRWSQLLPDIQLRAENLDDLINAQYDTINRNRTFLLFLSGLAIFTASLGLFGMAAFSVEKRTREIGVRKALGAGITDILQLFLFQFAKPVLVANLIAWPVAFYMMSRWLSGFQFRIEMTAIPFLLAAAIALAIAWLTIAWHALKIARTNPVYALRCE